MITLTILHADGSLYWTEYFNDAASAQAWLATEQTRPYWQASFTTTFTDNTPATAKPDPMAALRAERNRRLSACDWTMMADNQLEANVHAAWEIYRQALRALPETTADPSAPAWPVAPGAASG